MAAFLYRFFMITEETIREKILILLPLNFICQIISWIYGVIYFSIFNSNMTKAPKLLLIISSSVILLIDLLIILFFTVIIYQSLISDRSDFNVYQDEGEESNPVNFEEVPTLIWQEYHKLGDIECCIWMQNFKSGDIIKVLPDCFHYFHFLCIQEWFKIIIKIGIF